jgi:hypothetical protein
MNGISVLHNWFVVVVFFFLNLFVSSKNATQAAIKAPQLGGLLGRCGVDATILCHAWLKTAFAGFVPMEYTARIWDCFFLFGFDYLLRVSLAVLIVATPWLQQLPPNE